MRHIKTMIAAFLVLAVFVPFLSAADDVDTILEKLYSSPTEAQADYDRLLVDLAKLFQSNLRSPAAAVIYNRIQAVVPACTDPTYLDRFYADLTALEATRGIPNGFLAADVKLEHRENLLRQGLFDEAEALNAYAPFAKKMLVIGPFGFSTSSLHDVEFAPEKSLHTLKGAPGFCHDVDWMLMEREDDRSAFNLFRRLYPATGCTYALYQFKVSEKAPILLTFSTDASVKAWFNGQEIVNADRRKAYLPSVFKYPLAAAKGWNRVLLKFCEGSPVFSLRVTDRTGYPLPDLEEMGEVKLEPVELEIDTPRGTQDFDMGRIDSLAFLKGHAGLHPQNPHCAMALSRTLKMRGLDSDAITEGERALPLLPDSAFPAYYLGRVYTQAGYLPRNYRSNRARELFEKALEADSDFLPAQVALALNDHRNDRSEKAIGRLNKVLASNPRYYPAQMNLINVFDHLGWKKELFDAIQSAVALSPKSSQPLVCLAEYYQSLDRHDLALEQFRKALALDQARIDLNERVAAYLWDRGEKSEAFGLYERILSLGDPDENKERMASLHHALGDPIRAREFYTELVKNHPLKARYYTKLGNLALALDDLEEAQDWYEKSLALQPEQHHLRELLRLWKVLDEPLFDEFAPKQEDYIKNIPGKEAYPKASSVCSLDHAIAKVYPDGSMRTETIQIIKLLDKGAVEEYGRIPIRGRIETLKVIMPDGRILEPVDAEDRNVFTLPGLDVGAILVMHYTEFERATLGEPRLFERFFFQDAGCTTPFLLSQYVVSIPKGFPMEMEKILPDGFEEECIDREGETLYVLTARNVPVAERENLMPPDEEAFPNVNFYQTRNWVEVAQIMANGVFGALRLTNELRAKAEELTDGLEFDLDKARAIYAFVNEHVKEDRGSSMATSVLLEQQGSRASLSMALLDAAGVPYDYLRCGFKSGYLSSAVNWNDVSPDLFPNELIRLHPEGQPEVLLSFDNRMTPFGEIPPYLFDAPALKVTGKPERIETLPGGDPGLYREDEIELNIKVDFLDAAIAGHLTLPGHSRSQFRESMQRVDAHTRRTNFENRIVGMIYPGVSVTSLEILGVENDDQPPTFVFELEAKDFIHPVAGKDGCKILPVPLNMTRNFIRNMERTYPLVQRGYLSRRYVVNIDFGGEYEVEELPESLVERRFFLNYSLLITRTATGVRVERDMDFLPGDVEPDQYAELAEMLRTIDEREVEPIILKRTGLAAAEEAEAPTEGEPAEGEMEDAAPDEDTLRKLEEKG